MDRTLSRQYRRLEESHWWFIGRRQLLFDLLTDYRLFIDQTTILDFGCHSGFLVQALRQRGYDAVGADVDEEAVTLGKAAGLEQLHQIIAGSLPFPDRSFDVVFCLDVLEHIADERPALREIRRVLKPNGILFVTVPALPLLWGVQDRAAHHFRRYRKRELLQLLADGGFHLWRITYFNSLLFLPILLVRLWGRFWPPRRSSDFDLSPSWLNSLLRRIFLIEVYLLRRLNFFVGVSLLFIGGKYEKRE